MHRPFHKIEKWIALANKGIVSDGELSAWFLDCLVDSDELSVETACTHLPESIYEPLASRIKEIRGNNFVVIRFLIGDTRTPEEKKQEAIELAPRVKRVCNEVEQWLQHHRQH